MSQSSGRETLPLAFDQVVKVNISKSDIESSFGAEATFQPRRKGMRWNWTIFNSAFIYNYLVPNIIRRALKYYILCGIFLDFFKLSPCLAAEYRDQGK